MILLRSPASYPSYVEPRAVDDSAPDLNILFFSELNMPPPFVVGCTGLEGSTSYNGVALAL